MFGYICFYYNTVDVSIIFILQVMCYSYPVISYFVSSFLEEVSLECIYLSISNVFFAALLINLFRLSIKQVEYAAWQM